MQARDGHRRVALDRLVLLNQRRIDALRLLRHLLLELVELDGGRLELLVVDDLDAVKLRAGLGGAHAHLALLAVARLAVLAHLGQLRLIAGDGGQQLLDGRDLLLRLLEILRTVRLKVRRRLGHRAVQARDLIRQRFHTVAHDLHVRLNLLEDALLLQQEFAVLEQLLAVAACAHLLLILIQLHVNLLVLPQKFVLMQNQALLILNARRDSPWSKKPLHYILAHHRHFVKHWPSLHRQDFPFQSVPPR